MALSFTIGVVLPYVSLLVSVLGLTIRILYWARAPQHLHWELFPYPSTPTGQMIELLAEVFTLRSLYRYNSRFWLASLAMHYGIYLVVLWLLFLLAGIIPAAGLGQAGGALATVGALGLGVIRIAHQETRRISTPVEYLNLALVMAIGLSGLASGLFAQPQVLRDYLFSLARFTPVLPPAELMFPLFFLEVFLLYLPFSRMVHFAAKYFTYHKVKWGEAAR